VTKPKNIRSIKVDNKNQCNDYLGCTDENRIFCEEYAAGVPVCCELVPEHKMSFTKIS
jgi:hypothetical protein